MSFCSAFMVFDYCYGLLVATTKTLSRAVVCLFVRVCVYLCKWVCAYVCVWVCMCVCVYLRFVVHTLCVAQASVRALWGKYGFGVQQSYNCDHRGRE